MGDSPALGRFLQPDPLVPSPGNPQSLNRYSYVYNNPLKYTDPSGHWAETAWDIINIGLTLNDIRQEGLTWQNGLALAVDVGTALLPGVPAFAGVVLKGSKAAKAVAQTAAHGANALQWADRFAGASDSILSGVRRLENAMNAARNPAFALGYQKQLERAYELYRQGKLEGVEVLGESGGRYDFVLKTGEVVEFKYWTADTAGKMQDDLIRQILQYRGDGKTVILEFGITKTNPISQDYINKLLKALAERGITDVKINLVEVGGP